MPAGALAVMVRRELAVRDWILEVRWRTLLVDREVYFETETSAEISCTGGVRMSVDIVYSHDGI